MNERERERERERKREKQKPCKLSEYFGMGCPSLCHVKLQKENEYQSPYTCTPLLQEITRRSTWRGKVV